MKNVFLQVQRCRMARLEWFILKYESVVEKQRVPGMFRNLSVFCCHWFREERGEGG